MYDTMNALVSGQNSTLMYDKQTILQYRHKKPSLDQTSHVVMRVKITYDYFKSFFRAEEKHEST